MTRSAASSSAASPCLPPPPPRTVRLTLALHVLLQELVSDMYMAGRFNISLDHHARIFQSVHSTDAPLPDCHPEQHLKARDGYWYGRSRADGTMSWGYDLGLCCCWWWCRYNDYTKSKPAIFHFNGGGKARHLPMERQVWYKLDEFRERDRPDDVLDHKLWMGGEMRRLREVCPPDFYNIRG